MQKKLSPAQINFLVSLFGEDDVSQGKALLCIRDGIVNHGVVVDPEINLSATLLELQYITKTS
jgi:hypothetical protein